MGRINDFLTKSLQRVLARKEEPSPGDLIQEASALGVGKFDLLTFMSIKMPEYLVENSGESMPPRIMGNKEFFGRLLAQVEEGVEVHKDPEVAVFSVEDDGSTLDARLMSILLNEHGVAARSWSVPAEATGEVVSQFKPRLVILTLSGGSQITNVERIEAAIAPGTPILTAGHTPGLEDLSARRSRFLRPLPGNAKQTVVGTVRDILSM
jgi:hypothetical protein